MHAADSDDKPIAKRLRSKRWMTVWRSIATVAIGLLLTEYLPTRLSEEIGAQKMAKLVAPFEGIFYSTEHRKEIAVIVIDNDSLRTSPDGIGNGSWPAPYSYYSAILDKLKEARAKGVFVDVILSHSEKERDGIATLQAAVNDFDANSHVWFADVAKPDGEAPTTSGSVVHPPPRVFLAAQRNEKNELFINPEVDRLHGVTEVGIEFAPNEVDRLAWTYPLVYHEPTPHAAAATLDTGSRRREGPAKAADSHEHSLPRSAALSIYHALFPHPMYDADDEKIQSMSVTWGLDTAEQGLFWNEEGEEAKARRDSSIWRIDVREDGDAMYCTSSNSPTLLLWRAEARAWMRPLSRPLCVFHDTYAVSQVFNMTPGELRKAFDGRVVMIGTALRYSNDIVSSPLHDRIPGVFLHAMALDNLLDHPDRYPESWEPPGLWANGAGRYAALAALGVLTIYLVRVIKEAMRLSAMRAGLGRHPEKLPRFSAEWAASKLAVGSFNFLWYVFTGLLLIAFAIIFLLIGERVMHVPYLVVAHLIACSIAVEWLEWGEKFADWLLEPDEEKEHEKHRA